MKCEKCGEEHHSLMGCQPINVAALKASNGEALASSNGWAVLTWWAERKLSEARQTIDACKRFDMKLDGERWCGKAAALVELQEEMARITGAPPNTGVDG